MKKILLTTALSTILATGAFAQGLSGFYAGASVSSVGGYDDWEDDGRYELTDTAFGGIFAGYTMPVGGALVGAEVAYSFGKAIETDYEDAYFTSFADISLKAGVPVGNAAVYASIGYSFGTMSDDGETFVMDGMNYGVGVDYAISESWSVGMNYLVRDISAICPHDVLVEGRIQSISVRAAYHF